LKSSVTGLLSLVDDGRATPKVFRRHLDTMHDRLVIVERLLEDMRNYSQPTPLQRHRESIAEIVKEARSIVLDGFASANRDASNVEFTLDIPVNLTAEVSRQSMVMAIYNLIKNAYESFACDPGTFTKGTVSVSASIIDNDRIEIVIHDNGMGLSREELARVREFIPGGTSKKMHGTGFGLPTTRRRILDHGGQLAIHSEEGCGTTVIVTLPVKEQGGDE
jgi:signal transduction histidine kinase